MKKGQLRNDTTVLTAQIKLKSTDTKSRACHANTLLVVFAAAEDDSALNVVDQLM